MNRGAGSSDRRGDLILGVALLAAFSPGIFDLAGHWLEAAWPRYGLGFAALLAWCVVRSSRVPPRPRLGLVLIALCLVTQLLAALAAVVPVARPAIAGALIGFLSTRGLAPLRTALLAVFIVPIPYSVAESLGGQAIAEALAGWGAALVSALGLAVSLGEPGLTSGSTSLVTSPTHAGFAVLQVMIGLAWYAALRRGLTAVATATRIAGFLVLGLLVQGIATVLACTAIFLGSAPLAEAILDSLSWLVPAVIVVFRTERAVESGARPSA